jgi:ribosomal protein L29
MAKLEASRLTPVGDADPQALIRRVYFDLIGLPPTPEEVAAFLADPSEDAYAALVDRLLDSPRFGERWGRHWLDVVRYGESTGMDRDFTFPHAWRYRDYVIAAFNGDKPFDQFLREQIAGDLLGAAAADATADHWIATGMLSLGAKSMNEPNAEQFRMDVVDDQIDVVTRAFLGLTASCARCHDHKFDPIPQSEYYGLAGIFTSTQTCYGTVRQGGNRQPGSLIAWSETSLSTVSLGADPRDKDTSPEDLKKQLANLKRKLESLRNQPAAEAKTARAASRIEQQIKELQGQLARTAQEQAPADAMLVMGVLEGDRPGDTELRIRGEPNDRGARIPRSFLTIATGDTPPAVPSGQSGRLQLADWLLDEGNPLTARVAVNRIWQHLFGRGIVASVNNFGATGDPPTHPELLDHLALRLSREHGWSFKQMIRELVHTRTYRLGVDEDPQALAIDPDNKLLWRMNQRRLEVEAIRDAMLAVSGRLDVTPMEGSVVATIGDGDVGTNLRNRDFHAESFKRSVYLPVVRSALPEMLRLFDFPEPSIIADQRDVTTVPTQALFLMNSPFVLARAEEFAGDLLSDESLDDAARIDLAYQRALSRQPSAGEIELAYEFIKTISPRDDVPPKEQRLRGWTGFCQALLVSAEFRYLN